MRLSEFLAVARLQRSADRPSPDHRSEPHTLDRSRAPRSAAIRLALVLVACVLGLLLSLLGMLGPGQPESYPAGRNEAAGQQPSAASPTDQPPLHPVFIRQPAGPPQLASGMTNASGQEITVQCSACHATRLPNFDNRAVADLKDFHGNLQVSHGSVSCLACHNPDDYESLRLADGTRVEFQEVMRLCGQCHGPQLRDYERGVHGGMNGHWDLTRGPQYKNNCVDCHQPHAPKFPRMHTDFKPRDRFLTGGHGSASGDNHE